MEYSQLNVFGGIQALNSKGAKFSMDTHVHDEFVIAAYYAGKKSYVCPGQTGVVGKGGFLIIGPGIPHSAHSFEGHGCDYGAIYPTVQQVASATDRSTDDIERCLHGVSPLHAPDGGANLGKDLALLIDENPPTLKFAAAVFLSDIIARFESCERAPRLVSRHLKDVWARIYEEPDVDVELGDLAADAGVSREHLCRAFRATFGISPLQLLRARRAAYARDLIRSGVRLSEVASIAGYADQSHMSRWFRRIYGTSPKALATHQ